MALFTETCPNPLERVLRRDRAIVVIALAIMILLAWLYVLRLAAGMEMGGMDMTGARMVSTGFTMVMTSALEPWRGGDFAFMFLMWSLMMVAMMLPSATPMVLLYARVGRTATIDGKLFTPTGWFAAGYLLVWFGFAFAATGAQWALERAALLTPMMEGASKVGGGIVLFLAGLYQWSPLKDTCLAQCQAPLLFIQRYGGFRRDVLGALEIGIRHGAYCVGCCWALMTLLFVGGVMNVLWIAALAALVLAEKIAAGGRLVSRIAGAGLIVAGVLLLVRYIHFGSEDLTRRVLGTSEQRGAHQSWLALVPAPSSVHPPRRVDFPQF
jgi:predicted metal-binding membrane protein